MEFTRKLSEKEMVKIKILTRTSPMDGFCPFENTCLRQCYKLFTLWEQFRFIININACPCEVLSDEKVKKRTWDWINRQDSEEL